MIALLHLILFDFVTFGCYPLEVCSLLVRDIKEVDLEGRESGEELGGVEVRESIYNQEILWEERVYIQ